MSLSKEIKRRRTFAIISHPDAGKTTLTEKLLLFGGAIQKAGAVKSNKIKKTTASDFMEIEKQRGISVTTSVMSFEYQDIKINLLDTPGHQDFCEDTYRTLTAVDSTIMVIDCVKGVEPQTEKLLEVCRMRKTPVITFFNKLDREGQDAFELLDEVEKKLKIHVCPLTWPIGIGKSFKGVYSIYEKRLVLFKPHGKQNEESTQIKDLNDPNLVKNIGEELSLKLKEDLDMLLGVYPSFQAEDYLGGKVSPVFYGSAINNFGARELLDCFLSIAPRPKSRITNKRKVEPDENKFSGFVFKIHANMDPKHRDRLAFVRICSGLFNRGKKYHHVRLGKEFKFSNPTAFMSQDKEIINEAFPGDIIGLHDTGNFKIGDTLTEGESHQFLGIPSFSPEIFRYLVNTDPLKTKQLNKGTQQLMDEGVAQLFTMESSYRKIIGTVGVLQFDVIKHRLLHEYQASCRFDPMDIYRACWISSENKDKLKEFCREKSRSIAKDKENNLVFLAESRWLLELAQKENPQVQFHFTSEG